MTRTAQVWGRLPLQPSLKPLNRCDSTRSAAVTGRPWRRSATRPSGRRRRRRTPRSGRPGVQTRLAIPDQRMRRGTQRPQTAADTEQLGRLLGEDQRPGAGARIAQARDDDPRPPGLACPTGSRPWVPRDRAGRSRRAGRRSADRCDARRRTGGPRAGSHRRSSCRHQSPTARSAHGSAAPSAQRRRAAVRGSRP